MRDVAGKWILAILFYFFILTTVFYMGNNFTASYNLENNKFTSVGGVSDLVIKDGVCLPPRVEPSVLEVSENYNPKCQYLQEIGTVYNNETCARVVGCEWGSTSGLWLRLFENTFSFSFLSWEPDPVDLCTGEINATYFNNGVTYYGDVNRNSFTGYYDSDYPLYNLSLLQSNKEYCELFGFNYYDESNIQELLQPTSFKSIIGLIGNMFTFKMTYGFEDSVINTVINFILIILPLIVLVIASYIMIR